MKTRTAFAPPAPPPIRPILRRPAAGRRRALLAMGLAYSLFVLTSVVPASAADVTVAITDTLDPVTLEIGLGDSVTWRNDDGERHRMRSTSGPEEFDTGNLDAGESYTHVFTVEGLYRYHDERDNENPAYEGTIVVTAETSPPDASGDTTVDIVNRLFVPASVTVELGSTVTWDNIDDRTHTVTAYDGSFDSGIFDVGVSWSQTFEAAGVFDYFCILHPDMVGTVTVLEADGSEPPPPDPPPDPDPPPPPPPPAPGDVTIFDNGYTPEDLVVDVGATVTWTNTGVIPHTVTDAAGAFDSGILLAGETFTQTFDAAATYNYLCTIHPEMVATLTVQASDGTEPPPPAPPPDPDPSPPLPPPAPGDVTIFDNGYTPTSLEVAVGSTITWTNTGALPHTVTDVAGSFDSGLVLAGETYTRTFTSAATYQYFCTIHPEMVATLFVVGADGSDPPPPAPSPSPTPAPAPPLPAPGDVTIFDNGYTPATLEVAVGSTITWTNTGVLPHTVTDVAGSFDSGLVLAGDTYTRTFSSAATYNYLCTIHPEMVATLLVVDADGSTPPPAAPPVVGLSTDPPPAPRGPSNVVIGDNWFRPSALTVAAGSTITWTNDGALPHTVTDQAGGFDSGILMPGDSYRRTFPSAGSFSYLCTLHPDMVATVTVTEGGTPVGTTSDTADGVVRSSGSGAGAAGPANSGDPSGVIFSIAAIDLDYDPREAVVGVGTTVVWTNEGAIPHTVTSEWFDSGVMAAGDVFSFTFSDPGVYAYLCTLHPGMEGTVIVDAELAASGPVPGSDEAADATAGSSAATSGGGFTPGDAIVIAIAVIFAVLGLAYGVGRFTKSPEAT